MLHPSGTDEENEMNEMDSTHTLVSFSGVDVPQDVQGQIMDLLAPFDSDINEYASDARGYRL